jgi:hypothetical protein
MAETSPRRVSPWVAFAAGVLVVILALLLWRAWSGVDRAADGVTLAVPAPSLPDVPVPTLPDAPRIPDAPVPTPR